MNTTIFLGNVDARCNEKDIYSLFCQFGSIKKIKIFKERFQDNYYPIGFASLEFTDNSGYEACAKSKKNISYLSTIIHVYPKKPESCFLFSIFVFFSSESVNKQFLKSYFEKIRPSKISIISSVSIDKFGLAIIDFDDSDTRDRALTYDHSNLFTIALPSTNAIQLIEEDDKNLSLSFSPTPVTYFETKAFDRYLDLEIIHNFTPYRVNSYLASAFSTRIQQNLLSNQILNRIEARFNDYDGPFEVISNCLLNQPVEITLENAIFVFLEAADFGIEKLIKDTSGLVFSQLTTKKSLELYEKLQQIDVFEGPHVDFMAMHIDEMLLIPQFFDVSVNLLASIFRNKKLTIKNQQNFCNILLTFIQENQKERKSLIQFLPLKEMDYDSAVSLIKNPSININHLIEPLLAYLQKNRKTNRNSYEIYHCVKNPNESSFGVFATLCNECNGNPHDFDLVNITSSSCINMVIDATWDSYWSTPNIPNSWICFDFKESPIIPHHYSLKSFFSDEKLPSMVAWRIEGSNDQIKWNLLDEKRNVTEQKIIRPKKTAGMFSFSSSSSNDQWRVWPIHDPSQAYRFIKLTQIDKNGSGNHCLFVHGIEFYGDIPNCNVTIPFNSSKIRNGIFHYLTKVEQGNPAEKGRIRLTSSCDPKYLLDEKWEGCWRSSKSANSWVKIDLQSMRLTLSMYSLRSHHGPAFIQSWKVEVSEDDKKWILVDIEEGRDEYKHPYETYYWACNIPYPSPVRYIRFVNTDKAQTIFWLSNIELFGDLYRPQRS